ncbi:unnamed protein product, partial [Polarella glacialis]
HGLCRRALAAWFSDNVCEVASYGPLAEAPAGTDLVELFLENEAVIGASRFAQSFPSATVRPASSCDRIHWSRDDNVRAAAADSNYVPHIADHKEHCVLQVAGQQTLQSESAEDDDEAREAGDEVSEGILELQLGPDRTGDMIPVSLVLRSGSSGGTGARLWSGGTLLAEWLLRADPSVGLIVKGADVLELGAGAAALPSIAAMRLGARRVLATDTVQQVVSLMRRNLAANAKTVDVEVKDWLAAGRRRPREEDQFDIVLFADGIYTERGALLLADAAMSLLRPAGALIGALPDLRAGISSFEEDLRARGFAASEVPLDKELVNAASRPHLDMKAAGLVAGGSVEGYRLLIWRRVDEEQQNLMMRRRGKARAPRRGPGSRGAAHGPQQQ